MAKSPEVESDEQRKLRLAREDAERRRKAALEAEDDDDDEDDEDEDEDEDDEDDDRTPHVLNAAETVSAFQTLTRFLAPFLPAQRKGLVMIGIALMIETIYNTAFPLALKFLIDDAINGDDANVLMWILGTMTVLGIAASCAMIWFERVNAVVGAGIIADVRTRLFAHLQTLSVDYYNRSKSGEILQRFSSDMSQIEETVNYGAQWGVLPAMELVAGIILMFILNWQLSLVALLLFPIAIIGPRIFAPRAVDASYQVKRREGAALGVVSEVVGAQQVVKAFGLQRKVVGWYHDRNMGIRHEMTRLTWANGLVERSVTISVLALHLVVLGIGAYLAYNEQITIGTFVTFESLFWELSTNVGHLTQFVPVLIEGSGSARHIDDLLREPPRVADRADAVDLPRMEREVAFNDVTFSYDGLQNHLTGLTLTVAVGKRVAVVGRSGAGKSTIMNLILRLYDPVSGSVTIDGVDIATVTRDSLRGQMAVVFQENVLFNASMRENIRLGNEDATDEDVERAAKAAEIHKFIRSLPDGYDTIVGERGSTLSGGQRQRVAIARAIVRNPAILLLDEATSALDQTTEAQINKTLKRVSVGRTVIAVTHRLSTVTDMDEVIVLDKGRLAERGTHEALLKKRGVYWRLWQDQIGKGRRQDDEDDEE